MSARTVTLLTEFDDLLLRIHWAKIRHRKHCNVDCLRLPSSIVSAAPPPTALWWKLPGVFENKCLLDVPYYLCIAPQTPLLL